MDNKHSCGQCKHYISFQNDSKCPYTNRTALDEACELFEYTNPEQRIDYLQEQNAQLQAENEKLKEDNAKLLKAKLTIKDVIVSYGNESEILKILYIDKTLNGLRICVSKE